MALEPSRLTDFGARTLSTLELAEPTIVSPDTTLQDAVAFMRDQRDSCALVVDSGALTGIITERDVLCRFMDDGQDWATPVSNVMTRDPYWLACDDQITSVIGIMREHDIRTVPIVDGDTVRGVVRLGDLLRHFAELFPEEILNLPPRPDQQMKTPEGA